MITVMAVLHITEADLVRNITSVRDRAQSGEEIIIEGNGGHWPCCQQPRRRKLSEIMAADEQTQPPSPPDRNLLAKPGGRLWRLPRIAAVLSRRNTQTQNRAR